jgi:hypothetical protein
MLRNPLKQAYPAHVVEREIAPGVMRRVVYQN